VTIIRPTPAWTIQPLKGNPNLEKHNVFNLSFEPLSWDVAPVVARYPNALRWAVIGAASRGRQYYQPAPEHVARLLAVLDEQQLPVFFKGNLDWTPWREEYPLITSKNTN
jgi:hypothetical protein